MVNSSFDRHVFFIHYSFIIISIKVRRHHCVRLEYLLLRRIVVISDFEGKTDNRRHVRFTHVTRRQRLFRGIQSRRIQVQKISTVLISSGRVLSTASAISDTVGRQPRESLKFVRMVLGRLDFGKIDGYVFHALDFHLIRDRNASSFEVLMHNRRMQVRSRCVVIAGTIDSTMPIRTATRCRNDNKVLLLIFIRGKYTYRSRRRHIKRKATSSLRRITRNKTVTFIRSRSSTSYDGLVRPYLNSTPLPYFRITRLLSENSSRNIISVNTIRFVPRGANILNTLRFHLTINRTTMFLRQLNTRFSSIRRRRSLINIVQVNGRLDQFRTNRNLT